jgi:hypothetical protein
MSKQKAPPAPKPKRKRGRPDLGKRGRVMAFYARPELEKEIRQRAADEDKPIGAVISDAVTGSAK